MPRCLPGGVELNARRVGEAEERAGPGHDRVPVLDTLADQDRQGVAVAEDQLPVQGLRPRAEAEGHEQPAFRPGDRQECQLARVGLQDHSSSRQTWLTLCLGEMPVRSASWSSSAGRELIRIALMMRSRWLPGCMIASMLPGGVPAYRSCGRSCNTWHDNGTITVTQVTVKIPPGPASGITVNVMVTPPGLRECPRINFPFKW